MKLYQFPKATLLDRNNKEVLSFNKENEVSLMSAEAPKEPTEHETKRRSEIDAKLQDLRLKFKNK